MVARTHLVEGAAYLSVEGPDGLWYVHRAGLDSTLSSSKQSLTQVALSDIAVTLLNGPLSLLRGAGASVDDRMRSHPRRRPPRSAKKEPMSGGHGWRRQAEI